MRKLPKGLFLLGLCGAGVSPAVTADAYTDTSEASVSMAVADETTSEAVQAAEPVSAPVGDSGWQFSAKPYFWFGGLKGDLGVTSEVEPVAVDLSFGTLLDALKFAAMGSFEARKDRFVASADIFYISLGTSKGIDIREVDFLDVDLKSKQFISTLTAGYRPVDEGRQFVDLFAGGRIYSMKTSLDLEGPQRSFSGSVTETWIDPVLGVRFQSPIDERWSVAAYGDIGGFGIGSHLTWQFRGDVQYDLGQRWSLSAGWRHLDIDYDHNGFVFDAALDGPILGAVYRF